MKIAITARGNSQHAVVNSRLSHTGYFMLYDPGTDTWESLPHTHNQNLGETLTKTGVNILITGYIDPNSFKALYFEKIKTYSFGDVSNATVEEMLGAFIAGKLTHLAAPNLLKSLHNQAIKEPQRDPYFNKKTSSTN